MDDPDVNKAIEEVFAPLFRRPARSHKYDYGHVLVVGGSPGMVGAPLLTGMAALRSGAGLVTIAAPPDVTEKLERRVKEIMTLALPAGPAAGAVDVLARFARDRKVSAIVVGPGLKATAETAALARALLSLPHPVVMDGGALQKDLIGPGKPAKPVILTPHVGEFRRLGATVPEAGGGPALGRLAADFARRQSVIMVLKGHPTYVAQSNGRVYENTTGNPGLATAGTGDVLAGVIAGLVTQGISPAQAAESGVYLHGLAGDLAAAEKTEPGMIAGDVVDRLPEALLRVKESLGS